MPFCPNCHDEYDQGFTVCSDCGAALVDTPTWPMPRDLDLEGEEALLVTANNQIEASIVEGILTEAHIPYRSSNAAYTAVSGIIGVMADMSTDYFVMQSDFDRADALIKEDFANIDLNDVQFEFPDFDEK